MLCRPVLRGLALSCVIYLVACDSASPPNRGTGGAGGQPGSGGSPATGGASTTSARGGSAGASISSSATGGNANAGAEGGATGGKTSSGGSAGPGSGGRSGSGGVGGRASADGGSRATGGVSAAGGAGGSASGGHTGGNAAGGSSASGGDGGNRRDASATDAPTNRDAPSSGPEPFTFGKPPLAAARFKKGINLGNRLEAPSEGDWGGKVLAGDFPFIAKRGFDHVRIPIRFSGHASSSAPYTIDASFFSRVDAVLDQALGANLAIIVDMHAYDEMASNPQGQRERFVALWSQIASRYQQRPDSVAFELLNEPNTQLDGSWNDMAAAAITVVRATNPRRLLVVDTVFWADPSKLSLLTLPDDANLLVAVHLYEPKLFSFQGKSWIGPEYMTTGVLFPGPPATPITPVAAASAAAWAKKWFDDYNTLPSATNPSGPATVTAQIAYLTSYQQAQGRTVYNGEWGPQDGGAMDARVRLVTEVRKQCDQAGVGWAIWEDPTNMKLFDSTAGTWVTAIVDALLP